ncbi:MAG: aspartate kinase [Candidatus Latescibacteria bacterium]|nr:aspartate kinase [Candidatus Latescibacterota bacterium]
MKIIVQKFGGSVINNLNAIKKVANIIIRTKSPKNGVVVVVSAMGDTTDSLTKLAYKINPNPSGREKDMLLSIGERLTMSLLALALNRHGYQAISFTGSQVGIITNNEHTDARIVDIKGKRLRHELKKGKIPIVAGFQGVSQQKEITTLGRGGSDVTAVALAAYLKADVCEFYKDVAGIFTENPKQFANLKHVNQISYQEINELTTSGSEVLHPRACALAYKYNIPLVIKSFKGKDFSTMIRKTTKGSHKTEKAFVRAITHSYDLCRLSLLAVPQLPKCLHQVIVRFAQARVPIIFFSHGVPHHKKFDLSFIVSKKNYQDALKVIKHTASLVNAEKYVVAHNLASISLIGPGIRNDVEIFTALFDTLHKLGIHIDAFTSSEMKITCFLKKENVQIAVNALLKRFNLVNKK